MSLTSVVGKICEMVISERWVQYLEKNEVVSNCQYGLRKARSCITNLLSFYTRVIDAIDERDGWVDTVYLDIKKRLLIEYLIRDCCGSWNMWED